LLDIEGAQIHHPKLKTRNPKSTFSTHPTYPTQPTYSYPPPRASLNIAGMITDTSEIDSSAAARNGLKT
jgi:hypothetical protein